MNLNKFLKDANERVRQAAADALNEAADELQDEIRNNMAKRGIKERTGRLRGSLTANKATTKRLNIVLKSEVYVKAPKRPGSRNPAMRNRYKWGVPYGRILEFSPRINKPFFYSAWYKKRTAIKESVIRAIGEAWNG